LEGSFLSEDAKKFSVIFNVKSSKKGISIRASGILAPKIKYLKDDYSAFYQYTFDKDLSSSGTLRQWKDENE
jgi:hypothetical protein